ncbi:hybrid-cluster NAD(P)-dependent oxidoreductase [Azospirillum sp.]|uniref:hybrid-cluster NAD(P)-dependent oxidoreductase n=1 Tax=Azospirillum sp. TaxID=34012 RepID=UPI002D61DA01|nr:hybrid-cluster NAD(P)-dependent oxidoreductase [Azospirillum sp.]HYF89734.1 hybrid-cluster NAD(P)-dependent oxidoreductase [Azospirillum sp.]
MTMQQDAAPPSVRNWDPEIDDTLVCRAVRDETHDVKTFIFAPRHPCLFRFKPGQFITLELPIAGETIHRSYTVSSSAARPHRLSITVKRVPGGPVSNWLHDTLKPGDTIRAVGPLGEFTPGDCPGESGAPRKFLFLSGGSGVTPLMSMTRTFDDLGEDHDIVFVHAARTPADIVFRRELDALTGPGRRLRVAHVCEGIGNEAHWAGFTGRLSLPMLGLIAPDFMEREVYVCGPGPFMKAVRAFLEEGGFDMSRYHQESFNFEELSAELAAGEPTAQAAPPPEAPPSDGFRVEFAKTGKVFACPPDMALADAAASADIRVPTSCSRGLCGTCKTKLISGTVEMNHTGGIRKREIDQGLILLCCSRPTSDLVIER